jgi:hypothetical protein
MFYKKRIWPSWPNQLVFPNHYSYTFMCRHGPEMHLLITGSIIQQTKYIVSDLVQCTVSALQTSALIYCS